MEGKSFQFSNHLLENDFLHDRKKNYNFNSKPCLQYTDILFWLMLGARSFFLSLQTTLTITGQEKQEEQLDSNPARTLQAHNQSENYKKKT